MNKSHPLAILGDDGTPLWCDIGGGAVYRRNERLEEIYMQAQRPRPLTFGSLFAGIGGIDLGLERAGMQCAWQVEIDNYATQVLAKHWPDVHRERDVRTCGVRNLPHVDLIAGGFPCQDISYAGRGEGLAGERSGLWFEYARIICELRPRYVLVENVTALLDRGMGDVLGTLASFGYDAEWDCVPAEAIGAPHQRDRVFIVAYSNSCDGKARLGNIENGPPSIFGAHYPERNEFWLQATDSIDRMDDGVSSKFYRERVGALGNAVVPQMAEFIGRHIVAFDRRLESSL